jgi:CHAT domain
MVADDSEALDLAREFREIDEEVQRGAFRDAVVLILVPGTRPVDLLRKLNEAQPQVVHFSSHGTPDEIYIESGEEEPNAFEIAGTSMRSADDRDMKSMRPDVVGSGGSSQGPPQGISKSALVSVLGSCDEGNLRLVVLNACHSRSHAEALAPVVDCVASMNRTISDRAAVKFAASFYGALAFGRSVQKAFDQGVARLKIEGFFEADVPELLVRTGVNASLIKLVGPPCDNGRRLARVPSLAQIPGDEDLPKTGGSGGPGRWVSLTTRVWRGVTGWWRSIHEHGSGSREVLGTDAQKRRESHTRPALNTARHESSELLLETVGQRRDDQTSEAERSSGDRFDAINVEQFDDMTVVRFKGLFYSESSARRALDELGTLIDRESRFLEEHSSIGVAFVSIIFCYCVARVILAIQKTLPPNIRFVCCPTFEGCIRATWLGSSECRAEVLQGLEIFCAFRQAGLL